MLFTIFAWIAFSIVIGFAACARGRSGTAWFFLSLLISPLLSIVLLFIFPPRGLSRQELATLRTCPHCAELVKREAKVCKHCQRDLPPLRPGVAPPHHERVIDLNTYSS